MDRREGGNKRKGIMMMREKKDYEDEREKGLWWERKGIMRMREKRDYDERENGLGGWERKGIMMREKTD